MQPVISSGRRVLLVNPFVYDIAAYDCWAKPKGLLEVGRMLQQLGFRVDFVDCLDREDTDMADYAERHPEILAGTAGKYGTGKYFRQEVEKPRAMQNLPRKRFRFGLHPDVLRQKLTRLPVPDMIGVTGIMTYWWRGARDTIRILKECFKNVPVVLGGIYPSLLPDHAGHASGADIIFEGALTKERLMALLEMPKIRPQISAEKNIKKNINHPFFPYAKPSYGVLNLSEGCNRNCSYCASRRLRPRLIMYDLELALADMAHLCERGVCDFAFYDDFLLHDTENRLPNFLKNVLNDFPPLRFHTPNGMHLDRMSPQIAALMHRVGFATLRFGFETANMSLQQRTGFKLGREAFRSQIEMLFKAGFTKKQIGVYLLVGLPDQSVEDVKESIHFVRSCGAQPYLTEFSPIPQTVEFGAALNNSPVNFSDDPELQSNTLLPLRNRIFSSQVLNDLKNLCYRQDHI